MSTIKSSTTSTTAYQVVADTTGTLVFQTGATPTTALTIGTDQSVTMAGTLGVTGKVTKASMPVGSVIQVVSATYSTAVTSSTSTYVDTGLTASITPTSATNKILVLVSQNGVSKVTNDTTCKIQLLRGASSINVFAFFAGRNSSTQINSVGSASTCYLDSPATTSATTYKTQFASSQGNASATVQEASETSTITLLEVVA